MLILFVLKDVLLQYNWWPTVCFNFIVIAVAVWISNSEVVLTVVCWQMTLISKKVRAVSEGRGRGQDVGKWKLNVG